MALSRASLYRVHVANYHAVADAMERVARQARLAIRSGDDRTASALTKTFALLFAAKLETRLGKLLYEPSGFTAAQREIVLSRRSQFESWTAAIDLGFRLRYNVRGVIDGRKLPHSAFARYQTLVELVSVHFRPPIELRNKLAHGQWVYPLTASQGDVSAPQRTALARENLLSLEIKDRVAEHACRIINDLVVSAKTFERDFDLHFRRLAEVLLALEKADFGAYKTELARRYKEGQRRRRLAGR